MTDIAAKIALNDDSHLHFSQEIRKRLVNQYIVDGLIPVDPKMATLLLSALKDMDKVTLSLKKIDAEKESGDADRQALAEFHRLTSMVGARDYHRVDSPAGDLPSFDPNDIPSIELAPGELEVGAEPIDYDALMNKQDAEHKASLQD